MSKPDFSIGIEEEYLLVDPQSRDLGNDRQSAVTKACATTLGKRVTEEYLSSQIEIGTSVCKTISDARDELKECRSTVAKCATDHDLALMAAATHPFAKWYEQQQTDKQRYDTLSKEMQAVAQRLLTCGMHVHIGIDDDETRIAIMNQMRYFLPHLLALSTSSPFWGGENTGLKSYRLTVFDAMPRSGLPPYFPSWSAYRNEVGILQSTGVLEDLTKIWWDIRPHPKFPTVEIRICDVCTRLDEAIAITALCASLCHMLHRLRRSNTAWRNYSRFLLSENRWRAQRYGTGGTLVDFGKNALVEFDDLVSEILELVAEDAEALDCAKEVASIRDILKNGSSADRQLSAHEAVRSAGGSGDNHRKANEAVVDHLLAETMDFAV